MIEHGDSGWILVRLASHWTNENEYRWPTVEFAGLTVDDAQRHLRDALVDFLFDDGKHSLSDYDKAVMQFIQGEKKIPAEFEDLDWEQCEPNAGFDRRIGSMNGRYIYARETLNGAWRFECYHTGRLQFSITMQKVFFEM